MPPQTWRKREEMSSKNTTLIYLKLTKVNLLVYLAGVCTFNIYRAILA